MHRATIRIVALVVMAVVIFVFVAPLIDLEPSALRAQQFAQLFLIALVSGALLLTGWRQEIRQAARASVGNASVVPLQDLNCVRLC